ncbi:hypothetical protein N431DRAFT_460076 [Stipitochalara longipes BDJ]|nr:hypothetical protein N431DRAFT_460076 [Stipitochalara longipes BDJ]
MVRESDFIELCTDFWTFWQFWDLDTTKMFFTHVKPQIDAINRDQTPPPFRPLPTQVATNQKDKEIEELRSQLRDRDNQIARLQDQISAMNPSFEIGVAIRHRFLQKERISIAKSDGQADNSQLQDIIDKGNAAAHGGNGTVDAALLNSDLIPEQYKQIFGQIYIYDVDSYLSLPARMRKVADIHATVSAEIGIYGGLGSATQRQAIIQVLIQIENLYKSLDNASFDQSPEVENLLARAESMKDELVKTYKQRFNRNRFPVEPSPVLPSFWLLVELSPILPSFRLLVEPSPVLPSFRLALPVEPGFWRSHSLVLLSFRLLVKLSVLC